MGNGRYYMIDKTNLPKALWYDFGDGIKMKIVDEEVFKDWDCPILDWEGLEENGKILPYNKENAFRILKEYNNLAYYIITLMGDPALERVLDAIYFSRLKQTKKEN